MGKRQLARVFLEKTRANEFAHATRDDAASRAGATGGSPAGTARNPRHLVSNQARTWARHASVTARKTAQRNDARFRESSPLHLDPHNLPIDIRSSIMEG